MKVSSFEFNTGKLTLNVEKQETFKLERLIEIGERENPKRPYVFINKLMGRYNPSTPKQINEIHKALAEKMDLKECKNILTIGLAEAAVSLGAGIHREIRENGNNSLYLATTRYPDPKNKLCSFEEPHSHAKSHYIHYPDSEEHKEHLKKADTLIIIDDEITTGNTVCNLIDSLLKENVIKPKKLFILTPVNWSFNLDSSVKNILIRNNFHDLNLTILDLVKGTYDWKANLKKGGICNGYRSNSMPLPEEIPIPVKACRKGIKDSLLITAKNIDKENKILIIGSGEYTWEPFLVAEHLENNGFMIDYVTTVRSPIFNTGPITRKIQFKDNYQQGINMFLYNINPINYDKIFIYSETPADFWDGVLIEKLGYEKTQVIHHG